MRRKSIATALLFVIIAWTEMAFAPMLAMRAHHISSVAGNSPTASLHSCCPEVGKSEHHQGAFPADSISCLEDHRCCFQHGPQNVPSPVPNGSSRSQAVVALNVVVTPPRAESTFSHSTAVSFRSLGVDLGMVLRV
jgi:hypothetical protein